eukprot:scaffold21569_cov107-Isochrysis_galbana.AAC.5
MPEPPPVMPFPPGLARARARALGRARDYVGLGPGLERGLAGRARGRRSSTLEFGAAVPPLPLPGTETHPPPLDGGGDIKDHAGRASPSQTSTR